MSQIILFNLGHTTALNGLIYLKLRDKWDVWDCFKNYIFMGFFYLPSSIAWIKLTNKWKANIFTELTQNQRQNFHLMYFASKKALSFDLLFNHFIFQSYLCVAYCGFLYYSKLENFQKTINAEQVSQNVTQKAKILIQTRIGLSAISTLADIWLPTLILKSKNFKNNAIDLMQDTTLRKSHTFLRMFFTIFWHYSIVKTYFE